MLRLFEQQTKKVSFTFGRFNPPTTGHEKLIKALAGQGGTIMVFPSQTQDPKKNPLPFPKKVAYMKKMFPRYAKNIIVSKARQVFEISNILHDQGYTDVTMVVGSDRVKEFETLLNKYNGKKGTHGFYDFNSIKVVSAGDRDPDADDVSGMSASKMRAAAGENNYDSFKQGLPSGFKQGEKLFKDVRDGMGLKEQNWTFEEMLRDAYIRGELFNINEDVLTTEGISGKIVRKGTNYVVMETNDGLHKAWITDLIEAKKITKTKQEDDVEDVKGSQPAKYYAKDADGDEMSKSTKVARARHFAKGDSRKPAPGDKNADTKPSQYTKKFKQMYGERKLTGTEKGKLKDLEKDIDIKDFIDRYGEEEGKSIYYATLTKIAKKEGLWDNIRKKKERIAKGSGEKMRSKGDKGAPTSDQIKRAQGESYEIGKDYADHTKEIDPYSAPDETNEKSRNTLTKDKKLPNLMIPKKGKAGQTKYMKRKTLQKLAADVQAEIDERYDPVFKVKKGQYAGKYAVNFTLDRKKQTSVHDTKAAAIKFVQGLRKNKSAKIDGAPEPKKRTKKSTFMKGISPDAFQRFMDKQNKIDEQIKPKDSLNNWKNEDAKGYAEKLINEYGQPDEVTETMLKWNKLGSFGKDERETYIIDESIPHAFPKPHRDYVYTVMNIKIPSDMLDTLGHVTGSIIYDGLKEEVTARCGSLYANAATMGFVRDMVDGKVPVEDESAKKEYAERIGKDPLPKFYDNRMNEGVEHMCGNCLEETFQLDEKIAGLVNKSEKTGVPYGILKKSYDRGMAAWKGGHRPGASQQQWAFARVNSMLTGGKADPDLQAKIKSGGYKKKKKAKKESIEEWYFDNETRESYMERYGDEWEKNLNSTYERMLLKLSESLYQHDIMESEYQGKKVELNNPIRTSENPKKKFKVYVKNEKGKVVVVRFGDPNMSINRDDPKARKSFRARHQCDTDPGPKWKARYWSCYQWRAGSKVDN